MNARAEFERVLRQRAAYRAFFTALSERANDRMADEMIRAANAQRGGYEEREGLDYQGSDLRVQATTS